MLNSAAIVVHTLFFSVFVMIPARRQIIQYWMALYQGKEALSCNGVHLYFT